MSLGDADEDPTDFEGIYPVPGILPVTPTKPRKAPRDNASTAASAAGVRAFTAQAIAFYFRAPAKAFFRTRVDYLSYARTLQSRDAAIANDALSRRLSWLRSTTPGVLASAIRYYGWRVVPEQILPPLVANVAVGAVLYTSYLSILGALHEESGSAKRVFPPPRPGETFAAGSAAGAVQSVFAAPLDAIQVRYERYEPMGAAAKVSAGGEGSVNGNGGSVGRGQGQVHGHPQSMWAFGRDKMREIGVRGVFAGYGLSFLKDSFGSGVFFCTFEYVKAQGYYNFIRWYYGSLHPDAVEKIVRKRPHEKKQQQHIAGRTREKSNLAMGDGSIVKTSNARDRDDVTTIKPHYAIEPAFLFLGGLSASIAQSLIIYPLHHVQVEHWAHLEELDSYATRLKHTPRLEGHQKWRMMRVYYRAYQETWQQCREAAVRETRGRVGRWLYRGFWWNTVRQLPSTSAGLIIFELVRRRYGLESDEVRIMSREGRYDILVN